MQKRKRRPTVSPAQSVHSQKPCQVFQIPTRLIYSASPLLRKRSCAPWSREVVSTRWRPRYRARAVRVLCLDCWFSFCLFVFGDWLCLHQRTCSFRHLLHTFCEAVCVWVKPGKVRRFKISCKAAQYFQPLSFTTCLPVFQSKE